MKINPIYFLFNIKIFRQQEQCLFKIVNKVLNAVINPLEILKNTSIFTPLFQEVKSVYDFLNSSS